MFVFPIGPGEHILVHVVVHLHVHVHRTSQWRDDEVEWSEHCQSTHSREPCLHITSDAHTDTHPFRVCILYLRHMHAWPSGSLLPYVSIDACSRASSSWWWDGDQWADHTGRARAWQGEGIAVRLLAPPLQLQYSTAASYWSSSRFLFLLTWGLMQMQMPDSEKQASKSVE